MNDCRKEDFIVAENSSRNVFFSCNLIRINKNVYYFKDIEKFAQDDLSDGKGKVCLFYGQTFLLNALFLFF